MNTATKKSPSRVRFGIAGLSGSIADLWKAILEETVDAEISFFTDHDSVRAAATNWPGKFILFCNFPPDAVNGFTYNDSKKFFAELLSSYQSIDIHIITNAGAKTLSDEAILRLSSAGRITVQRAWEWADFRSGFATYVVKTLSESLVGTDEKLLLHPGSTEMMKAPNLTKEQLETHQLLKEMCQNADPASAKPENPNVDAASFQIWQRSNRIQAARKYADLTGD